MNMNASDGNVSLAWTHPMDDALVDAHLYQHIIGNRVKLDALEWMDKGVRNYEKFMQLFGKDKATGSHAETASEMRHRRANNEGIEIDNGQDKRSPEAARSQAQSEAPSLKKQKHFAIDPELIYFKEGLDNVATAIMKSTNEVANAIMQSSTDMVNAIMQSTTEQLNASKRLPIPESEIWTLIIDIGIELEMLSIAYIYLVQKPDMLRAVLGCPMERCKTLLLHMMAGGNGPHN
ncbi:hypothetical protein GH714_017609 [Hevea brasiliensis]|uniref:Uncharacterized protein n=1 Tax=Hevea brasiliensis TaxID=3981 RepID=A0A6A6M501_HEVBR|nr:hypothetical protein GH714_017609 [Hevea brasiliensis]